MSDASFVLSKTWFTMYVIFVVIWFGWEFFFGKRK